VLANREQRTRPPLRTSADRTTLDRKRSTPCSPALAQKAVEQGLGPDRRPASPPRHHGRRADALRSRLFDRDGVLIGSGHSSGRRRVVGRRGERPARRFDRAGQRSGEPAGAFFDSVTEPSDGRRCCSAACGGTSPRNSRYLPNLAFRRRRVLDAHLLRAGPGRVARPRRARRPDGARRALRAARIALAFPVLVPVLWLMLAADRVPPRRSGSCACTARPPGRRRAAAARAASVWTGAETPLRSVVGAARRVDGQRPRSRPVPNGARAARPGRRGRTETVRGSVVCGRSARRR